MILLGTLRGLSAQIAVKNLDEHYSDRNIHTAYSLTKTNRYLFNQTFTPSTLNSKALQRLSLRPATEE